MLRQGVVRPWVGTRELMMREAGFAGVMLFGGPTAHKIVEEKTHSRTTAAIAEIAVGVMGALLTHPADTLATYRQKHDGKIFIESEAGAYTKITVILPEI